jgi:hypothetical protein
VNLENQRQRAAIEHQRRAGEEPTEEHDGHGRTGELETLNQAGNSVATKARPKANPPGKLPSNATKGKGKTA